MGIVEGWLCDTEGSHPDMLIITWETYHTFRHHREIADRIMAEFHFDPADITEMRVSEGHTEVDQLWRDKAGRIQFLDGEIDVRTAVISSRLADR